MIEKKNESDIRMRKVPAEGETNEEKFHNVFKGIFQAATSGFAYEKD